MNKKIFIVLFSMITMFLLVTNVSADFPITHFYITDSGAKQSPETEAGKLYIKYPELVLAGNLLSDSFVSLYYERFKSYQVTHTPSFATAILKAATSEQEKACAWGGASHQPQDLPSHEKMVPYAITHTLIPNVIAHPPTEQNLDTYVEELNPDIDFKRITSTNAYKICKPLFIRVLSANDEFRGIDLNGFIDKFIKEVQSSESGYDPSFNNVKSLPPSILILFLSLSAFFIVPFTLLYFKRIRYKDRRTVLNWITFVLFGLGSLLMLYIFVLNFGGQGWTAVTNTIIKPLSPLFPITDKQAFIDEGIKNTVQFFREGESYLYNTDASGELILQQADKSIEGKQYIFIFAVLGAIIWVLYRNFKPRKEKGGFGLGSL